MTTMHKTNIESKARTNYTNLTAAHDADVAASVLNHNTQVDLDFIKSGESLTRNDSDLEMLHHSMTAAPTVYASHESRGGQVQKPLMIMTSMVPAMNSSSSGDLRAGASPGE